MTFVFLHGRTTLPHKYAPFPHPEIIKHNQLDCNEQFCAMFGKISYYYFLSGMSAVHLGILTVRLIKHGNNAKLVLYSWPDSPLPHSKLEAQDLREKIN